jgi:hypothetical protein
MHDIVDNLRGHPRCIIPVIVLDALTIVVEIQCVSDSLVGFDGIWLLSSRNKLSPNTHGDFIERVDTSGKLAAAGHGSNIA